MRKFDVLVVGGGLAGLIAACETAKAGLSTLVVESSDALGGRARTRLQGEFSFNQGPHALFASGALRLAIDQLGVTYQGAPAPSDGGKLLWGEALHPMPSTALALMTAAPLSTLDRVELASVLRQIAQGRSDGRARSFSQVIGRYRPKVRKILEGLARLSTYSNSPDQLDGKAALEQIQLSFSNVIYLDGGWITIVNGLSEIAERHGTQFLKGVSLATLNQDHGEWRAQLLDGPLVAARSVILATDPSTCARLVPEVSEICAAADQATPVKAVCLDLALSSLPEPKNGFALGIDEPMYFSVHSKTAKLAPDGGALIHLAWYLAPDELPAKHHIERLEWFADKLQSGWRSFEISRQQLLGITVAHDYPRVGHLRADVSQPASAPLYLAGDWVGDMGWLSDASAASARLAASLVKSRLAKAHSEGLASTTTVAPQL